MIGHIDHKGLVAEPVNQGGTKYLVYAHPTALAVDTKVIDIERVKPLEASAILMEQTAEYISLHRSPVVIYEDGGLFIAKQGHEFFVC